jgi:hypothetical protein
VPRAAESEAAADSTGTTTPQPVIITTAHGPAPGDSGQTKLRNSDQEEDQFMNSKNRTFDGSGNRWVTITSSGSPLQRILLEYSRKHTTELLRPSSTSFFFRNPSFPLVSSPIPRPTSLTPIPPRLTAPVILPPSPLALAFPAGPGELAHVTPRPGPRSRDSPDSHRARFRGSRGPAPLSNPGTLPTAPSCHHARTLHVSRLVSPHR